MFFGNLAELGFVYLRIRQWPVLFVCLSLAQLLVNVGLNVWFIAFRGMGVWGFVLARLLAAAVGAIISLAITTVSVGWRFHWDKAISLVKFGAPLIVSSVSVFVIHFSDRFFLSKYGTLAQVGIYALAYKVGFLVTYAVGEPFGRVWSVTLYGYVSEPRWQGEFARVLRYLTFALFGMALALSIFSTEGLSLVSSAAYGPAAALVAPIAFGYALREGGDFFRGVLFINRRTKVFGMITLFCAALNIVLNFLWIPTWGPAGAAWATFFTWFAYMILCWSTAVKEHRIPYTTGSFVRVFVLACVACFVGRQIPEGNLLLSLPLKTALLLVFAGSLRSQRLFFRERNPKAARLPDGALSGADGHRQPGCHRVMSLAALTRGTPYRAGILGGYHRIRNRRRLTVVMFHRVLDEQDSRWCSADPTWTVSTRLFGECLEFFQAHYHVIGLEDLQRACSHRQPLPERPLLITFDDGWADNAEYALPYLRAAGLPAVVFVVAGAVGESELWNERLGRAWRSGRLDGSRRKMLSDRLATTSVEMPSQQLSRSPLWNFVVRLSALEETERCRVLADVIEAPGDDVPSMLTIGQLRELHSAGIAIGAHGLTHAPMPAVAHPGREITEPRRLLTEMLGLKSGTCRPLVSARRV